MIRGLVAMVFLIVWAGAVTVAVLASDAIVNDVEQVDQEQLDLEQDLMDLRHRHRTLQAWVIEEFRPWVDRQVRRQARALPSAAPVPPLPSPPPVLVPSPTVSPIPTETPSPSPTCVPLVEVCV